MSDTLDSITKLGTLAAVAIGGYFILKKFGIFDKKDDTPAQFITPNGQLVATADSAENIADIQSFKQLPIFATKNGSNSSIYSVKPSANLLLNPATYLAGAALTGQIKKTNVSRVTEKQLSPDAKMILNGERIPFTTSAVVSSSSFNRAYTGQSNALSQSAKNSVLSKSLMKKGVSSVDLRSRAEKQKDILKK